MILCGTGHRPPSLGLDYDVASEEILREFVLAQLQARHWGIKRIISGMAQGFDQALAEAAIAMEIPLTAAIPFVGMDSRWPERARERYRAIIKKSDDVQVVSPGGYADHKFAKRDRWMVDNADSVAALYNGNPKTGTGITVKYANSKKVPLANWWDAWLDWCDARFGSVD